MSLQSFRNKILKLMGFGLALYALLMSLYIHMYFSGPLIGYVALGWIFLAGLFLLGLAYGFKGDQWRRRLVLINIIVGLYFLFLGVTWQDSILWSYFLPSLLFGFFLWNVKPMTRKNWKTILIVDDDETQIKIVRPVLVKAGYSVLTSTSGEEALRILDSHKPDLVLLDVIMPGLKGREVCKRIKQNPSTQHIPVIFLTAKDSQDDVEAELAAGAHSHMTKPVQPKVLLATVEKIFKT